MDADFCAQFTFFLNIQGNIIPFLKDEFALPYSVVTLHPAAVALGLIVSGLIGERLTKRLGRNLRPSLSLRQGVESWSNRAASPRCRARASGRRMPSASTAAAAR